jgi:hypothetical protein
MARSAEAVSVRPFSGIRHTTVTVGAVMIMTHVVTMHGFHPLCAQAEGQQFITNR